MTLEASWTSTEPDVKKMTDWLDSRLPVIYVLLSLAFGCVFLFLTPPNGAPDEISHQVKVVRIARGNLFGVNSSLPVADAGAWYSGFDDKIMADSGHRFRAQDIADIVKRPLDCKPSTTKVNNGVASYSPVLYLPAIAVYATACSSGSSFGAYLYGARLLNLVLVTMLIGWAMTVAGSTRWIMFAVGLLPVTMYQVASISGDALLLGFAIAYVGLLGRMISEPPSSRRGLLFAFTLLGVALCFSKPGYVWLAWVGPAVIMSRPRQSGCLWAVVTVLVASFALQALLLWLGRGASPVAPGVDPAANLSATIRNPFHFLIMLAKVPFAYGFGTQWNIFESLLGKLGWLDAPLPSVVYLALAAGLVAAPLAAGASLRGGYVLYLSIVALASVILIALPLRLYATPLTAPAIFGLQGRYYIPTLALTMLCLRRASSPGLQSCCRMVVTGSALLGLISGAIAISARYHL